ncbi:MAG: LapD/MoxY N-terminal periplasmic domain-containing protein [Rhodocyclaceae bacterium]|nr:LapD/MoxY N-terminal periplasmic domain-containing protein [Rhodocyclaceae bacterium]
MSLTKQLWLAIATVMTIVFGGAFVVSTLAAKRYLEEQLYMKNVDNATALALSMSQLEKDPVTVELQLSAQFDAGHYRSIRLTDPAGETLVERSNETPVEDVPGWFIRLIPLTVKPGVAQVQDGWKQFATLTLESHTRFAYAELWQGTLRMLSLFLATAAASGLIGTALLRLVLRPLREVVDQAEAIGGRRFITTREPRTSEFRSVVRAMNALSERVRAMVTEESRRVDELRRQAQTDPLTGLLGRESFGRTLEAALTSEDTRGAGCLAIARIADLASLNRNLGREVTDQLLRRIGERLQSLQESRPGWAAGRLNGADFAILAPGAEDAETLARRLAAEIHMVADPSRELRLPVGATPYRAGESVPQLLARADGALATAEANGDVAVRPTAEGQGTEPQDMAGWRSALEKALRPEDMDLGSYPVQGADGALIHREAPARLRLAGAWLPAGRFVAWAGRLGLLPALDSLVVDTALARVARDHVPVGVNLSPESVRDATFLQSLVLRLKRQPALASLLWLEVPEYGAFRHLGEFRAFCMALKPLGCHLGLEHVGPSFSRIGELHDVGLDYLKIDASIIRDIQHNPGNQAFLRGLCMVAHSIGLMAIAEGVVSEGEKAMLPELGVDGMTGPAIG